MDSIELQTKQDESTINDVDEKIELVSNTNIVTKEEVLHKLKGKNVIKTKMLQVTGQTFIQHEKELDESNQKEKAAKTILVINKFEMM